MGALPWLVNYNIALETPDLKVARRIARKVSERGGGLPFVQSMALPHAEGVFEVACNLLDACVSSPEAVHEMVVRLAAEEGVGVGKGYLTGKSPEEICKAAEAILR